ncbi:MAG: hypothetical protein A4E30_00098 [Methanomassiliicoccales archaeon PtaB.Bin215]|nr:MAG: hypothetical protein A4E30_00098 [Methanomassiliicoccales archaeon PtaB.Bin215]
MLGDRVEDEVEERKADFPHHIETEVAFAHARSSNPSPFRSAAMMDPAS